MLQITESLAIPLAEIEFEAVRTQGPGGQNVNKVSTAVQLRFDIRASSLPEPDKERLLLYKDRRINSKGEIVIKAQRRRSQEQNKEEALSRLQQLIQNALSVPKPRKPTRPTKSTREKRLDAKKHRAKLRLCEAGSRSKLLCAAQFW